MKNKRGWIRVVEAFVAILIIAGVLLVVVNKGYIGKQEPSEKIYEVELSILQEIEKDSELREQILSATLVNEISWIDFEENNLKDVKDRINLRKPSYLECEAKICAVNKICSLDKYIEKSVYAQPIIISATLQNYNPRQLKLFCWEI